jgi:protein transport protein SEC20
MRTCADTLLHRSRSQFRKAQLAAKHNADRAKLKERELLFSNLQSGTSTPNSTYRQRKQAQGTSEGEIVAQASSDVTSALRRTHQLMQGELSRSRFAQETLEQSTAALADLGERYTDLNSLLTNSKNLVSTLLRSTKSDTWYLETTFYILITTLIWLFFRRWLYGPLTWFVIRPIAWFVIWPLRILFRNLASIFTASAAAAATSASTSLIVKPSATGGSPRHNPNAQHAQQPYFRVGGGGRGSTHGGGSGDPSPPDSYSQKIGKMAENNKEEVPDHPQFREQRKEEDEGPVRRGDGTVLKERESGRPANPKKKMWDEDVEREKMEAAQKEGEQAAAGEGSGRKDKDEL